MRGIRVGDRVKLHAPSPLLTLRSPLGTVVRPDERMSDFGYWIVRLDESAIVHCGTAGDYELAEVVESDDNLTAEAP